MSQLLLMATGPNGPCCSNADLQVAELGQASAFPANLSHPLWPLNHGLSGEVT